jgi:hypothetical protein
METYILDLFTGLLTNEAPSGSTNNDFEDKLDTSIQVGSGGRM